MAAGRADVPDGYDGDYACRAPNGGKGIAMKKFVYGVSIVSMVLMFIFFISYFNTKSVNSLIFGVSMMTVCYHFVVRITITTLFNAFCTPEIINPNERQFQQKGFEKGLYSKIRVRRWKNSFSSFDPHNFSLRFYSIDELIFEGCKAEMAHRICFFVGFLSLIFTVWFGAFTIYLTASVIGAIYDLAIIVVQRFNRPRLMRIAATGKYN